MKTVLIIDDNEFFRFAIVEWLKRKGFYPIMAADGFEGVRLARSHHPDLIFCDMNMPEIDGIEVLAKLRQDLIPFDIPFFFLSGETILEPSRIQQLGATGMIPKNAGINELCQALQTID